MLSISRKGDYGLLLLTTLAAGEPRSARQAYVSLKDIANKKRLPYKFLSQVAGDLKEAKILESREGVRGGYRLARKPETILVREVLDALEGPMSVSECEREHECDCGGVCVHEAVEEKLVSGANRALAMFTVADLVADSK